MNFHQKKQLAMGLISRAHSRCCLLAPPNLWAWGQTGHRVTGGLAEPLLSAEAQLLVRGLLGPSPSPRPAPGPMNALCPG